MVEEHFKTLKKIQAPCAPAICRLVVHTPWMRMQLPDSGPEPWQSDPVVILTFCVTQA